MRAPVFALLLTATVLPGVVAAQEDDRSYLTAFL